MDDAARRLLKARNGLDNIFLRQFYLFGGPRRNDLEFNRKRLDKQGIKASTDHLFLQRFITAGYYALVEFANAVPHPDYISVACQWWNLQEVPKLILDHNLIFIKGSKQCASN